MIRPHDPETVAVVAKIDLLRAEITEILKDPERTRRAGELIRTAVEGTTFTLDEAADALTSIAKGLRKPVCPCGSLGAAGTLCAECGHCYECCDGIQQAGENSHPGPDRHPFTPSD